MKSEDKIWFDKRSAFLLEKIVLKEEGNDDEVSNEEWIKYMIFRKIEIYFLKLSCGK